MIEATSKLPFFIVVVQPFFHHPTRNTGSAYFGAPILNLKQACSEVGHTNEQ
jgi:hypothetical protein